MQLGAETWDYAVLSKLAKAAGGPEALLRAREWAGAGKCLGALGIAAAIGAGIAWVQQKREEKKAAIAMANIESSPELPNSDTEEDSDE